MQNEYIVENHKDTSLAFSFISFVFMCLRAFYLIVELPYESNKCIFICIWTSSMVLEEYPENLTRLLTDPMKNP